MSLLSKTVSEWCECRAIRILCSIEIVSPFTRRYTQNIILCFKRSAGMFWGVWIFKFWHFHYSLPLLWPRLYFHHSCLFPFHRLLSVYLFLFLSSLFLPPSLCLSHSLSPLSPVHFSSQRNFYFTLPSPIALHSLTPRPLLLICPQYVYVDEALSGMCSAAADVPISIRISVL